MREFTVDCAGIADAKALHRLLAETLSFPKWYGHNADALYDCLTDVRVDTTLTLLHFNDLGDFSAIFRLVLNDCENDNPHLFVNLT